MSEHLWRRLSIVALLLLMASISPTAVGSSVEGDNEGGENATVNTEIELTPAQKVLIPFVMYYVERYFSHEELRNRTEMDDAVAAILDNAAPEGRVLFETALKNYRELLAGPNALKVFDEQTLDLTGATRGDFQSTVDLAAVQSRLAEVVVNSPVSYDNPSNKSILQSYAPASPRAMTLENDWLLMGLDGETALVPGVLVSWTDDSINEDGFIVYRSSPIVETGAIGLAQASPEAAVASPPPVSWTPGDFVEIATVGPDTPASRDRDVAGYGENYGVGAPMYCYQVTAYRDLRTPSGDSMRIQSEPSPSSCIAPSFETWNEMPDHDKDGYPDTYDLCPDTQVGAGEYRGCPDDDRDGVPDILSKAAKDAGYVPDECVQAAGPLRGASIPTEFKDKPAEYGWINPDGCPLEYSLRFMGMVVEEAGSPIAGDIWGWYKDPETGLLEYTQKRLFMYDEHDDPYVSESRSYQEPYLVFELWRSPVDPVTASASLDDWSARWCCGERVSNEVGHRVEPDSDLDEEEFLERIDGMLKYGLTIFPEIPGGDSALAGDGGFAEAGREGFMVSMSLMEKDWTKMVPNSAAAAQAELDTQLKIAGLAGGAVVACAATGGLACLGGLVTMFFEGFKWLTGETPMVKVEDPDDPIGTELLHLTPDELDRQSQYSGAGGFSLPVPTLAWCLDAMYPYSQYDPLACDGGATMRTWLNFCIVRKGTPESVIERDCSRDNWRNFDTRQAYEWPQFPTDSPLRQYLPSGEPWVWWFYANGDVKPLPKFP